MGYLEGLLGGFISRKSEIEQENLRQGELAAAREQSIFTALLNSGDKETRDLALAGLLESAQPKRRKGGLRGWVGEMESSPILQRIRELSPTIAEEQAVPGLPSTQFGGYGPLAPNLQEQITEPPGPQAAAQPATALTGVGAPPPAMITSRAVPPPAIGRMETRQVPRKIFPTPEDLAIAGARGKARGDVEGEVTGLIASGFSEPEARELVKQNYLRRTSALPFQSIAGEVPNAQGGWDPAFGVFDRFTASYVDPSTMRPLAGFRPRTSTNMLRFGVDREAIARAQFGRDFKDLSQAEAQQVITTEQEQLRLEAVQRRLGTGQGALEAPITPSVSQQTGLPIGAPGTAFVGQAVPTMPQQDRRRSVDTLKTELIHIKADLLGVLPKSGELGGLAPGAVLMVRRRLPQYRTQVARLEAALNNVVNVVARSVGEQRGTQTEQDALRAEAAIVNLRETFLRGDTQESAAARIDETMAVLDQILSRLPAQPVPGVGTAPPAPGALTAQPTNLPSATRDANGNWIINIP